MLSIHKAHRCLLWLKYRIEYAEDINRKLWKLETIIKRIVDVRGSTINNESHLVLKSTWFNRKLKQLKFISDGMNLGGNLGYVKGRSLEYSWFHAFFPSKPKFNVHSMAYILCQFTANRFRLENLLSFINQP